MAGPEEVRFPAGDATLAGTLELPAGPGRHPGVLLLPVDISRAIGTAGGIGAAMPAWFAPGGERGLLARLDGGVRRTRRGDPAVRQARLRQL